MSKLRLTSLLLLAGVASLSVSRVGADFTAYNDCVVTSYEINSPYATAFGLGRSGVPTSGLLIDQTTGGTTPVTVILTNEPSAVISYSRSAGTNCLPGTDADRIFGGTVGLAGNMGGDPNDPDWWVEAVFTNLDPHKVYRFATTANRGGSQHVPEVTNRWTLFTLLEADWGLNASSEIGVTVLTETRVSFCAGSNTTLGCVAQWTGIRCGADRSFRVRAQNEGFSGHDPTAGYGFSVFMLEEATPAVAIISPTNHAVFQAPASVTINVAATNTAGPVGKVAFYEGSTWLGETGSPPFDFTWTNVSEGNYTLTAVATDASGMMITSAPVNIAVPNGIVQIIQPIHGARFIAPAEIVISASALATQGEIEFVDFLAGETWLGRTSEPPFSLIWAEVPAGEYALTAVVTSRGGSQATSAVVRVSVAPNEPPLVVLTAPADNSAIAPAPVTVTAMASDSDGWVTGVEFYRGATKLGADTASPFACLWSNPTLGAFQLFAVATDNHGATSTSAVVNVTVTYATIGRGPYLQTVTTDRAMVRWRTSMLTDSCVRYGANPNSLVNFVSVPALVTEHIVTLTNLDADTKYFYSVGLGNGPLAAGSNYFFVTAPTTARPVRIWVLGDINNAANGVNQRAVRDAYYQYAAGRHTDLCLSLGDLTDHGAEPEYQPRVFDVYGDLLRQTAVYPCIGNHDSETWMAQPYLDIFSLPGAGEAGGVASGTERYYSFDYGNIHFVVLDSSTSDTTVGGRMYGWLAQDLAANEHDWLIAYWHHPPYSRGNLYSDNESTMSAMRERFLPLLEEHGVDLVLCGHSHVYERSYLLDGHYGYSYTLTPAMIKNNGNGRPDGAGPYRKPERGPQPHQGVVYTVIGCSAQAAGGQLNHPAMVYSASSLGSLVLEIDGDRLEAKFLRETGAIDDYFTLCKGFRMVSVLPQPGRVALTWESIAGQSYAIYRKDSLNSAWYRVSSVLRMESAVSTWNDLAPPSSAAFYRVEQISMP